MEKTLVFLDHANVSRAAQDQGVRMDWNSFLAYLADEDKGRRLVSAEAFVALNPFSANNRDREIEDMWNAGFVVHTKLGVPDNGSYRCNMDVEIALAIELFTSGSLNTFANPTNVDVTSRLVCYDILDLGKQLLPIGMLVILDSILNRITQNRAKGKNTFIIIDEIYLLFQHEYSANFLFTLWKRVRKYGAFCTGITQNVDDLLQSHTARTMLANSEFIVMLNQASTDRMELAKLLNISDLQLSYITNVDAGNGLIKVGSSLVPFIDQFPRNTKLYNLLTTKPGEQAQG